MSVSEKIQQMVGLTPSHTSMDREQVRREATKNAASEWFALVIKHHKDIENAFEAVKNTSNSSARADAQEKLATIITGHSLAEETIVYPFMKIDTSAMNAAHVYNEHSVVKIGLVELDLISDKMSVSYNDKLEEIRSAIVHHMIEEERDFFPELEAQASDEVSAKLTQRYKMEFERYMPESRL